MIKKKYKNQLKELIICNFSVILLTKSKKSIKKRELFSEMKWSEGGTPSRKEEQRTKNKELGLFYGERESKRREKAA